MKTKPFTKIKPSDIPKMLKLKNKGWSFSKIGRKYNIHHTTVMHHLKRLKQGYEVYERPYWKKYPTPDFSRKLKPVKQYQDYLKEQENRKPDPLKRYTQRTP